MIIAICYFIILFTKDQANGMPSEAITSFNASPYRNGNMPKLIAFSNPIS
jgi:hypothetical protein